MSRKRDYLCYVVFTLQITMFISETNDYGVRTSHLLTPQNLENDEGALIEKRCIFHSFHMAVRRIRL